MNKEKIGLLLKELIHSSNIGKTKFAHDMGITKAAVTHWIETGGIKTEKLFDVASYFGITIEELIRGSLNDESYEVFLKRNYDRSKCENFYNRENGTINGDLLQEFLIISRRINNRFMELLKLWIKDQLSDKHINEFEYLKKSYILNPDYIAYKDDYRGIPMKSCDNEIFWNTLKNEFKKWTNLDSDSFSFELSKYLSLDLQDLNDNPIDIIDDYTYGLYLSIIPRYKKDLLLTDYLSNLDHLYGMEQNGWVVALVKSGAKVILGPSSIQRNSEINLDSVDDIKGKRKRASDYDFAYSLTKNGTIEFYDSWDTTFGCKTFMSLTYNEYTKLENRFINDYLSLMINLREKEPLKYIDELNNLMNNLIS